MEARIESDIACIKAAVSNYAQRDARCALLDAKIERINKELEESRSRIFELELFQSLAKGLLSGLAAALVIALIISMIQGLESHHSNDGPPDKTVPEQADVTHSGVEPQ